MSVRYRENFEALPTDRFRAPVPVASSEAGAKWLLFG